MVEVVTAKVGITVCRLNFKHAVAKFEDRDIECTATEVEHCDLLVLVALVKTIGKRGRGRFVYNTAHLEACDFAGFLGGLTLRVIEVGRNCDDSFVDSLSEIILGSLLHLLKYHR